MGSCSIRNIFTGQTVMEGAGVRLKRLFGFGDTGLTDPFLLFDHFGSSRPEDYLRGFPWHPHRGIETVTYMTSGRVEHQDSLGNSGIIEVGDAQWMTAGSGIIHQEMPLRAPDFLSGFQLWVNLPRKDKMCSPRYRDIRKGEIPLISLEGSELRLLSGESWGRPGAARDIAGDPIYADVRMEAESTLELPLPEGYRGFAYFFQGSLSAGPDSRRISEGSLAGFSDGDRILLRTGEEASRFIWFAGKPLNEPVAWQGPIVMNTREELETAFREYRDGTFIKD